MRLLLIVIAGLALALSGAYRASGSAVPELERLISNMRDFQMRVEQRVIVRFPNQPLPSPGRNDGRKAVIYNEERIGNACFSIGWLVQGPDRRIRSNW